jgi:hypothetical protein
MPKPLPQQPPSSKGRGGVRSTFRGLSKVDTFVWLAYLEQYGHGLSDLHYNIAVGQWVPPPNTYLITATTIPHQLLAKRIDVVGYLQDDLTLWEVKPRLDACAVGQVQTYVRAWRYTYPQLPVPKPVIVYGLDDRDVLNTCLELSITTVKVNRQPNDFLALGYKV